MPLDPTERKLLFQTGIRTVKKLLVLRPSMTNNFTVGTGLALPFERRMRPKAHQNNELRGPNPPPPNSGSSSPVGTSPPRLALHKQACSDQHRSPESGPIAGPRPYEYKQEHEEPQGTAHAVRYDPFQTQSTAPVSNGSTHLHHILLAVFCQKFPPHLHPSVTAWPRKHRSDTRSPRREPNYSTPSLGFLFLANP